MKASNYGTLGLGWGAVLKLPNMLLKQMERLRPKEESGMLERHKCGLEPSESIFGAENIGPRLTCYA